MADHGPGDSLEVGWCAISISARGCGAFDKAAAIEVTTPTCASAHLALRTRTWGASRLAARERDRGYADHRARPFILKACLAGMTGVLFVAEAVRGDAEVAMRGLKTFQEC